MVVAEVITGRIPLVAKVQVLG